VGNFFTTPLDATVSLIPTASHMGHFVQWDPAVPPAAPNGYIGDPAILHKVVGSPCGQNFFRVEGPGFPGGAVQTDLFSVIGKRAVFCGNGFVDPGEECDDRNVTDGDCCSSTCQLDAAGTPCDDGNACTINETCDATGVCTGVVGPPPVCPTAVVEADVSVDNSSSKTAKKMFGKAKLLNLDASPIQQAFLQTRVTGLGAHGAGSAKLRLVVAAASKKSGGQVHAIPCGGFSEATTTYNNRPPVTSPVLSSLGKVSAKKTVEFEVGSALDHGDGLYCFALDTTSSDDVDYNSREAKSGKPSLAILNVDGCDCVP
jgi:cysteine-rich repeat protein